MYHISKRIFDIISSTIVIFIISPILLPIIVLLRLTSEGEVFYLQKRMGYKNKTFMIFKFATMLKNSSKMKGGYITVKNDPRLTYMGDFLRRTKINEVPQLLNIIYGHMSVVGPRPVMPISFEAYPVEVKKIIYDSKPGLTGIGSIVFRDEEKLITDHKNNGGDIENYYKNVIYPFKGKLEIWYKNNSSIHVDFILIILTIWVILFPESRIYEKILTDLPKRNF